MRGICCSVMATFIAWIGRWRRGKGEYPMVGIWFTQGKRRVKNPQLAKNVPLDFFGPTSVRSLMHKKYGLVVTDDYSIYTWVFFLATKDETSSILKEFITGIENLVDKTVKIIRCDNGTEFKNSVMNEFYVKKCIRREFSIARIPQQNGVVERRNRTLIKDVKTRLADFKIPTTFWANAVNTACYVQNRALVVKPHNKTPYELFRGRKPALSFMRPFRCHVTILNTLDDLGKFDVKLDEGFFVGYSMNSKAFRVYNIRTRKVEENLHIEFLENKPIVAGDGPKWLFDIDMLTKSMNYVPVVADGSPLFDYSPKNSSDDKPTPSSDANKKGDEVSTASPNINTASPTVIIVRSNEYPDDPKMPELEDITAYDDSDEEADFTNLESSIHVNPTPTTIIHKNHPLKQVIGSLDTPVQTRSKLKSTNEQGFISAVYKGKTHKDLNTCLFACFLSQIEPTRVAKALTNPVWVEAMQEELLQFKLQKEVYVSQPSGFEDPDHPNKVYKVVKAIYGLHQAPRAWYETLANYLLGNGFHRVKQKEDRIFISQDKYVAKVLRKFNLSDVKSASTLVDTKMTLVNDADGEDVDVHLYRFQVTPKVSPLYDIKRIFRYLKGHPKLGLWYPRDSPFELVAYTDSDYVGASFDRKSTTKGYQFLGSRLISWQCKKQTVVATSITEVEYVAVVSCRG
ncbi:putative ribonuclease H-like domain-containing protein [Tanacetum coccineum]|uniref:Ribonuclease H-like domain-containing protein n=1 Tax=Tanacetum coccineum TaxID=301880 RepID=A0ABQ5HUE4_9ASTR